MHWIMGAIGFVLTVVAVSLAALLFWLWRVGISRRQNQKAFFDDSD